jgi:phosphatidylglycerol:prolipoprotein diacylglycerol transferase
LKYVKAPILPVADMVAPFMALAHGIGRVGCFLNGCCWGSLANFHIPWGACYPKAGYGPFREQVLEGLISSDAVQSLPVHPTQLYETIGCLIIFICLLVVYKKHKHAGVVTLTYLMLYGGQRFITEMFRGDSARPLYGLTVSQIFGLSLFVFFGLLLLLLKKTLWKHSETAADGQEQEIPAAMVAKVSDGQTEEA